ncbi:MAG TPA: SDR family oxidoreductase [bacterium]|nr:SDR family oxidoreductase [bacterium]
MELKDKVAVVTGGGSGLGRSLALELAKAGAKVVITDIVEERIEEVVQELKATGAEAGGYKVDGSDYEAVRRFSEGFFEEWGHADILCLNAGVLVGGVIEELKIEDWQWIVGVNFWGAIYMVHLFAPKMIGRKQGKILITASAAGLTPLPGLVPYSTTKFAMVGLSQALRVELAKHNIGVTVLCPGGMNTNIGKDARLRTSDNKIESRRQQLEAKYGFLAKDPAGVARDGLKGLLRDKPIVVSPRWQVWPLWLLVRFSPTIYSAVAKLIWKRASAK